LVDWSSVTTTRRITRRCLLTLTTFEDARQLARLFTGRQAELSRVILPLYNGRNILVRGMLGKAGHRFPHAGWFFIRNAG